MEVKLGIFVVPDATDAASTVEQIVAAEESGLEFVGVQDHPYQWRFFDTWTLLAYAAGRTERVRFVPDVLNLPLRLPALIAKSVASLDVLSGGRVELGIGAGAFWAEGPPSPRPRHRALPRPEPAHDHQRLLQRVDRLLRRASFRRCPLPGQGCSPGSAARSPGRDLAWCVWTSDAPAHRPDRERMAAEPRGSLPQP